MMRLLFSLCACLTAIVGKAQDANNFIIEGTLKNLPVMPAKMYLVYDSIIAKDTDSVLVKGGRYTFKGNIDEAVMAYISPLPFDNRKVMMEKGNIGDENVATVFLDRAKMNIVSSNSIANAIVSGSTADKDYKEAVAGYNRLMDTAKNLANVVRATGDQLLKNMLMGSITKMTQVINDDYYSFMKSKPQSPVNPYLMYMLLTMAGKKPGRIESLDSLFNTFPAAIRSGRQGRVTGAKLANEMKTALGHRAVDFSQADTSGKTVSLSSFQGKYVLIDFWSGGDASLSSSLGWTANAFKTYRDKGFTVIGVSLDEDKDKWMSVVRNTP